MRKLLLAAAAAALLSGCTDAQPPKSDNAKDMAASEMTFDLPRAELPDALKSNTLLAKWEGAYGGLPAFESVKLEDLKPALEYGMERSLIGARKFCQYHCCHGGHRRRP